MKKWTIAGIAIVFIAVLGALLISGNLPFAQVQCQNRMLIPILGRIACEPVDGVGVKYSETYFPVGTALRVRCGDGEFTDKCEVKVTCNPMPIGVIYDSLKWRKNLEITWRTINNNVNQETYVTTLNPGETVEVWCRGLGLGEVYGSGTIREYFQPFTLYRYDSGGKWMVAADYYGCDLMKLSLSVRDGICYSGFGQDPTGTKVQCSAVQGTTALAPGQWINYVTHWATGPFDLNTGMNRTSYNGQTVYCQGGTLFSIGQIELADGCYNYPDQYVATVACCPGDYSQNLVCGSDFQWHPVNVGDCVTNSDCMTGYECVNGKCTLTQECFSTMQCMGMGEYVCDPTHYPMTATVWGCLDFKCVQTYTKQVDCCPPDIGCPSDQVCNAETFKCVNAQPTCKCGNNECEPVCGENMATCPQDCAIPIFEWWWFIIGGLVTTAFAIVVGKTKKWGGAGYLLGGVIGVLVSVVLWYLLQIPAWVYGLIALLGIGGVILIFAVGGGAFLIALILALKK